MFKGDGFEPENQPLVGLGNFQVRENDVKLGKGDPSQFSSFRK